jgi:hypothetical protein
MNDVTLQGRNQTNPRETSSPLPSKNGDLNQSFPNQPNPVERLQNIADSLSDDEILVDDSRAGLSPAQMVEHKLVRNLRGNPMPVRFLLNKRGR